MQDFFLVEKLVVIQNEVYLKSKRAIFLLIKLNAVMCLLFLSSSMGYVKRVLDSRNKKYIKRII